MGLRGPGCYRWIMIVNIGMSQNCRRLNPYSASMRCSLDGYNTCRGLCPVVELYWH